MKNVIDAKIINSVGREISYDAAVVEMDSELCDKLHSEFAPCTNQKFYNEYCAAHLAKFGADFVPDTLTGNW